ncbi:MAG: SRPBCC family protein [Asticcacaulis sp.]|nr:SRPBCC family protein [Asticcacaulis sp.]
MVFFAWSNGDAKASWFAGPSDWDQIERKFDFRPGGEERLAGRFASGMTSDFRCRYHDIVQDQRIIYAYDMFVDDKKISVSLASIEFEPKGTGTRLKVTEQIVHLDGYPTPEDREVGTRFLVDKVAAYVESLAVKA